MANLNLNKTILGGRLTADVELKTTPNGIPVCSFILAVNRKTGKDKEQQTDFISCVAWRQTAEFISKYFRKGSSLCIAGSIQTRTWTDQNNQKRYATEVIVDEAIFVDSKSDSGQTSAAAENYMPEAYTAPVTPNFETITDDDEIPF